MTEGLIIAFHTTDALYTGEARRLRASVERFGLPIELTPVESAGDWVENCSRKPAFLLERRRALRGQLLYVDVDAVVHDAPWLRLADIGADIGVFIGKDGKLRSGTILLNDTPGCQRLLEDWAASSEASPRTWDQVTLQTIVNAASDDYCVAPLSVEFCYIFDSDEAAMSDVKPVVEHLQASREWRAKRRSVWRLWRCSSRSERLLRRRQERIAAIETALGIGGKQAPEPSSRN